MRLVIDLDGTEHEVHLDRASSTATLADLIDATGAAPVSSDEVLWVNDEQHAVNDLLHDITLLEGSVISRQCLPAATPITGWSATVSGGLAAGPVLTIPSRRPLVLGRSPQADITVESASASWTHLTLAREGDGVRLRDQGSTNGTHLHTRQGSGADHEVDQDEGVLVDDGSLVVAGGTTLLLRNSLDETPAPRAGSLHNATAAGTVPFNRPPRPGRPPAPQPVIPPTRKDIGDASRFNIIMVAAPLVMAVGMVLMMHDMRYATFALVSPVMAVGSWAEQKHRHRRDTQAEDTRFAEAVATFATDLATVAELEARRRALAAPDPATTMRRALLPSTQLWERRWGSDDFLLLHAGTGSVPWTPPVESHGSGRLHDDIRAAIDASHIPSAPVEVDLTGSGVVGIVGPRAAALAVARSLLVQAGVHCGPADLTIGVFCDQGREGEWEWASWLPHTRRLGAAGGERWVSGDRARSNELLRALRDGIDQHPTMAALLLLDSDVLTEGRDSPARFLLGHGRGQRVDSNRRPLTEVSGIVIASTAEQLPASCTVVITVGEDADATVTRPGDLTRLDDTIVAGVETTAALTCARHLAHYEDPELVVPGAALPGLVRLPELLDLDQPDAEKILTAWSTSTGVGTPVGVGESGSYSLDLVKDGPHGLVGGTTGSGKSEFLRTLVAGLAARNSPDRLTFILMDFKGGAAFSTCERLPHTIGTVSNLDEQLADRALRALEAEMDYRQRLFAAAGEGVDNLDAYLATNPAEPLPRLLLVVDEFAMLAKDYPDVLQALVSVAAVGRTLGVHMILATQRPAGVVNDDILANTNLRVALRVQSRDDSTNVIDVPDAAAIANSQKGRAYVKLGQDDITPVQTALVTGTVAQVETSPVEVSELHFGVPVPPKKRPRPPRDAPSDLDLLIDAIVAANEQAGHRAPRPVWPEPLDARVDLAGFGTTDVPEGRPTVPIAGGVDAGTVTIAVSDDPDHQRQTTAGWDMDRGNLLAIGIPGYGTTTTLSTIALALACEFSPEDLDLLVLDMGSRDLEPLQKLPHTSSYVGSGSGAKEQQMRFLRHVRDELDRRRAHPTGNRRSVYLIDGLAALRDEYQDYEGMRLLDGLYRAYADGPELGMHFAVTTSRARAIPAAIDEVTTQKWLFRLADHYDYSSVGIRPQQMPAAVPGRCVLAETRLQTHVATPVGTLDEAVAQLAAQWGDAPVKAPVVGKLPESVTLADMDAAATIGAEPWLLPVGVREADLRPQLLELYEGEHLLVAGPPRSGRSSLLLALADAVRNAPDTGQRPQVWGICDRRSPLGNADLDRVAVGVEEVPALVAQARIATGPLLLLVDDAERFDDSDQAIAGLLEANLPNLHVVAAGRADDLRSLYSHWTKTLRKARCGVLLQPSVDYDGDLMGVTIPRTAPVALTIGRGYACMNGQAALVQAVRADG